MTNSNEKHKGNRQNKWIFLGLAPILILSGAYLVTDFIFSDDTRNIRAMISFILAVGSILLSAVAAYKLSGLRRLLPILGIVTGLFLLAWTYFVLAFWFTY